MRILPAARQLEVKEDTPVRSDLKTIAAVAVAAVTLAGGAAFAWAHAEAKTERLEQDMVEMRRTVVGDHDLTTKHVEKLDTITKTLDRMDAKLDVLIQTRVPAPLTASK